MSVDWVGKDKMEDTIKQNKGVIYENRAILAGHSQRLDALEEMLQGLDDLNLASVIHNFRYKIEEHSRALAKLKAEGPPGATERLLEALEQLDSLESFLDGSAAYEGVWFGDEAPDWIIGARSRRFWWRSALLKPVFDMVRAALAATQEAEE